MDREYLLKNNVITSKNKINKNLGRLWNKQILDEIIIETNFLPKYSKNRARIFCILNNTKSIPKCEVCVKNEAKFQGNFDNGYFKYCSKICANSVGSSKLRRPIEVRKKDGESNCRCKNKKWNIYIVRQTQEKII